MPKSSSIFKSVAKIPGHVKLLQASGFYPSGYGGTGKYFEFQGWDECATLENELAKEVEEDRRWAAEMESRFEAEERKMIWKQAQARAAALAGAGTAGGGGGGGATGDEQKEENEEEHGNGQEQGKDAKEERSAKHDDAEAEAEADEEAGQLSAPLRSLSALVMSLAAGDLSEEDVDGVTSGAASASPVRAAADDDSTGASSESGAHSVSFSGPSKGAGPLDGPLPQSVRAVMQKVRDALEMLKDSERSLAKWDADEEARRERETAPVQAAIDSFASNSNGALLQNMGTESEAAKALDVSAITTANQNGELKLPSTRQSFEAGEEGGEEKEEEEDSEKEEGRKQEKAAEDTKEEEEEEEGEEGGEAKTAQVVAVSTDLASTSSSPASSTRWSTERSVAKGEDAVGEDAAGDGKTAPRVANAEAKSSSGDASPFPAFNFASIDSSEVRVTDVGRGGGGGGGDADDYDASLPFAEVMRRVQDNQPIPGIKTIPDK